MTEMRAGPLRHRVTIEQKNPTRDTHGGEVPGWTTLATVWAAVEFLQGREYFDAQQIQAQANVRVRLRYRSDVTSDMRVVWDSRNFLIVAPPMEDSKRRELVLLCQEVT